MTAVELLGKEFVMFEVYIVNGVEYLLESDATLLKRMAFLVALESLRQKIQ